MLSQIAANIARCACGPAKLEVFSPQAEKWACTRLPNWILGPKDNALARVLSSLYYGKDDCVSFSLEPCVVSRFPDALDSALTTCSGLGSA